MPGKKFGYQEQDCPLTLQEGLEAYFQGHPGLFKEGELGTESQELFHSHDLCHIVFGLDTTLEDEALADVWTILGTDVGFRRYMHYLNAVKEAKAIFKEIGYGQVLLTSLRALPKVFQVWCRTRRMCKKWPWIVPDGYYGMPLAHIRREFNIRVI
jgi:hypothetical protein